jgi:hypothetical protein
MTALMLSMFFVLSGFSVGVTGAFLFKEVSKTAAVMMLVIWLVSFIYSFNFFIRTVTFW